MRVGMDEFSMSREFIVQKIKDSLCDNVHFRQDDDVGCRMVVNLDMYSANHAIEPSGRLEFIVDKLRITKRRILASVRLREYKIKL